MTPPQKRPELSPLKRVFISPGWIVVLAIACFAFWRARNPETSSNSTNFKEPSKARETEVKQYVSSINRGQQAFYAENARFTSILQELGLGIKSETQNYSYSIVLSNDRRFVQSIGLAKRDGLKGYTGIVFLVDSTNGKSTSSLFCESNQPSKELPGTPVFSNSTSNLQCPLGYSKIN